MAADSKAASGAGNSPSAAVAAAALVAEAGSPAQRLQLGIANRRDTEAQGLLDYQLGCNLCGDRVRPGATDPNWAALWFDCKDCGLKLCAACLRPEHPPHHHCRPLSKPGAKLPSPAALGLLPEDDSGEAPMHLDDSGPAATAPKRATRGKAAAASSASSASSAGAAAPKTPAPKTRGRASSAAASKDAAAAGSEDETPETPGGATATPRKRRSSSGSSPELSMTPAEKKSFRQQRARRAMHHDRQALEDAERKQAVVDYYRQCHGRGQACSLLQAVQNVWPEYYEQHFDAEDPMRSRSRIQAAVSRWGKGRCVLPPGRPKMLRQTDLDEIRAQLAASSEKTEEQLIMEKIRETRPDLDKISRSTMFRLKNALQLSANGGGDGAGLSLSSAEDEDADAEAPPTPAASAASAAGTRRGRPRVASTPQAKPAAGAAPAASSASSAAGSPAANQQEEIASIVSAVLVDTALGQQQQMQQQQQQQQSVVGAGGASAASAAAAKPLGRPIIRRPAVAGQPAGAAAASPALLPPSVAAAAGSRKRPAPEDEAAAAAAAVDRIFHSGGHMVDEVAGPPGSAEAQAAKLVSRAGAAAASTTSRAVVGHRPLKRQK